ncbi:hypothetical protein K443DRAFT_682987 [Laccaria amethystina LaAM-08-1]|uniref:Uncharacterized protein n=1 Tax=Laccaria amethystina LaAM-08-1 TaxID=1095629 RepID=A0A0C9WJY0_9AGAR|nr:hypothetical protein K443DRAFT_682987 [Laccaria amethystina LaAM-08-1]
MFHLLGHGLGARIVSEQALIPEIRRSPRRHSLPKSEFTGWSDKNGYFQNISGILAYCL